MPADTTRDAFGNNVYAGPLARTITDAAIMHAVLVGPERQGSVDARRAAGSSPLSPKLSGEDLSGVRIGYIELTANPRIAADVRANTRAALAAWQELGADGRGGDREDRLDRIRGPRALPGELRGVLRAVPAQVAEPDGSR